MYLPSNGITGNVLHHDIDLHFQGHTFWNVSILISERISQTATDSRKIPTDIQSGVRGTIQVYLFSQNFYFLLFPAVVENSYSQFSRKLIFLRIMINVLGICKKYAVWMEVTVQLSLHFPGGKCVTWKNRTKRWISRFTMNALFRLLYERFLSNFRRYEGREQCHKYLQLLSSIA